MVVNQNWRIKVKATQAGVACTRREKMEALGCGGGARKERMGVAQERANSETEGVA